MDQQDANSENALDAVTAARDLATLSAVEILSLHAVDLLTAGAVKLGLYENTEADLAEARMIITALAGFLDAAAPELGSHHAAPLRDGLQTLQYAFKEASSVPDAPGSGPGEKYTGPIHPRIS